MTRPSKKRATHLRLRQIEQRFAHPEDPKRLKLDAFWHLLQLYNSRCTRRLWILRLGPGLVLLTFILGIYGAMDDPGLGDGMLALCCCLFVANLLAYYGKWPFAQITVALNRIQSTTDIRPLISLIEFSSALPVTADFFEVLATMQLSHNSHIAAWEHAYLGSCLRRAVRRRHERQAIAILHTVQRLQVTATLPLVKGYARSAENARIRRTAESCVQALMPQAEQENAVNILLRAAAKPEIPADMLLRAAEPTDGTSPDELLRADSAESQEEDGRATNQQYWPT